MKHNLAKIISYMFVPPINLLFIFIVLSNQIYINPELKFVSIVISAIFGLILPVTVFIYLRKKKRIVNDDATIKGERTLPYVIGTGLSINALVLSIIFGLHPLIIALWIAYILIQIAMLIINLYWKISAHLIGVGIPYATILFLFQTEYIYLILIPIIIGWARFTLKVHTPMQIVAGFLLGTIPTYFILTESIKLL